MAAAPLRAKGWRSHWPLVPRCVSLRCGLSVAVVPCSAAACQQPCVAHRKCARARSSTSIHAQQQAQGSAIGNGVFSKKSAVKNVQFNASESARPDARLMVRCRVWALLLAMLAWPVTESAR
jgi:hypothetical protein